MEETLSHFRYENCMLKRELANEVETRSKQLQEISHKHSAEVAALERERDEVLSELRAQQADYKRLERPLHQANIALRQELQVSREEQERLRGELAREVSARKQLENELQALHSAHHGDMALAQAEKAAAAERATRFSASLEAERTVVADLKNKLDRAAHELTLLKSNLAEAEQEFRAQLQGKEAESDQLQQQLEERDARIKDLSDELSGEQARVRRLLAEAEGREQQHSLSLAALRDQLDQANQRSATLMDRLQSWTNQAAGSPGSRAQSTAALQQAHQQQQEELRQQLQDLHTSNTRLKLAEQERQDVGVELREAQAALASLKREAAQAKRDQADVQLRMKELQATLDECTKLRSTERQCHARREALLQEETRDAREALGALQGRLEEELQEASSRVTLLEGRLMEKSKQFHTENSALRQKSKRYGSLIHKLRHRLQLGQAECERLEAQRAALAEDRVEPQLYRQLRRELDDLNRRHGEYSSYLRGVRGGGAVQEFSEVSERAAALAARLADIEDRQQHALHQRD